MPKQNKKSKGKYHKGNKLNELTGSEWIKFTKSWFIINPRQRKDSEFTHPAKFPEELAERYISFFTKKRQIVFDPFSGICSTLVGAENLGRKGIAIEYTKKYADMGKKRLKKMKVKDSQVVIKGDSQQINKIWSNKKNNLPKKIDFIITSPPYWNMLDKSRGNVLSAHKERKEKGLDVKYSNSKKDLGNIEDYEKFLDALKKVFDQCYVVLKSGGYMVVVLQNLRVPEGHMCTLAWDLVDKLKDDWQFVGEQIWLQDNKKLGIWGYPSAFVSNIHHHYCLIFYRNHIKLK